MVPTARFLGLLSLGVLFMIASLVDGSLLAIGMAYGGGMLGLLIFDYWRLASRTAISVERMVTAILPLMSKCEVKLAVENQSEFDVDVIVRDSPPNSFTYERERQEFRLPGRSQAVMRYAVIPEQRGEFSFGKVFIRMKGILGLAYCQRNLGAPGSVRVYPNFSSLSKAELVARKGARLEVGFHSLRTPGEGREFDRLRDYVRGDDHRWIDWKATARKDSPVTREYEIDRNQRLMIALDAGRRMAVGVGRLTRLDYAMNAALELAQVAVARDDYVGAMAFSHTTKVYLSPAKGRSQIAALAEMLYRVTPELVEPDYDQAFAALRSRNTRRTLIVVFTDILDARASQLLLRNLLGLLPRHLPMCVTIADSDLLAEMTKNSRWIADVYNKIVARQMVDEGEKVFASLEARGVHVVNVPADKLSASSVQRYLSIKTRGLL